MQSRVANETTPHVYTHPETFCPIYVYVYIT